MGQPIRRPPPAIVAVDPGRDKCGLAVLSAGQVTFRALIPTGEVGLTCRYVLAAHPEAELALGGGTGSEAVREQVQRICPELPITTVEERDSTLEARALYWQDHPPRGFRRLLPEGMRVPPRPIDDYAAVVIARRRLNTLKTDTARD